MASHTLLRKVISQRFKQFRTLPIYSGDHVLNFCCGPSLFVCYAADLLGPAGHVTGLDHDPVSPDFSHRYLAPFPFKNWNLIHTTIEESVPLVEAHNVILLMNRTGYLESPLATIRSIASLAKRGTRIIIKNLDLGSVFLSPIDPNYYARLVTAAMTINDSENPLRFDNFLGRQLCGRREKKSGVGVTNTWFLNDGDDEIGEYDSTKTLATRYVPGPAIDKPPNMLLVL